MNKRTSFDLVDVSKLGSSLPGADYDLAIIKVLKLSEEIVAKIGNTVRSSLSDDAFVVYLEQQREPSSPASEGDSSASSAIMVDEQPELSKNVFEETIEASEDFLIVSSLASCGYSNVLRVPQSKAFICKAASQTTDATTVKKVSVMHLSSLDVSATT